MILGNPGLGELIALKRCSYRNTKSIHPITFTAPQKTGEYSIEIVIFFRRRCQFQFNIFIF